MNAAHKGLDDLSFPSASGVVARKYCLISGDIATATCTKTASGYYKSNNVPSKCKDCAIRHGIGQGIPDVIPNTETTTEVSTTKKPTPPGPTPKPSTTVAPPTTSPTTQPVTTPTTAIPDNQPSETVQAQVEAALVNQWD